MASHLRSRLIMSLYIYIWIWRGIYTKTNTSPWSLPFSLYFSLSLSRSASLLWGRQRDRLWVSHSLYFSLWIGCETSTQLVGERSREASASMASTMMMLRRSSLAVFVLLGFSLNLSESLRFELVSGRTKCIAEDMRSNSMSVGKYKVINPNEGTPLPDTHKVTVRVGFQKFSKEFRKKDPWFRWELDGFSFEFLGYILPRGQLPPLRWCRIGAVWILSAGIWRVYGLFYDSWPRPCSYCDHWFWMEDGCHC